MTAGELVVVVAAVLLSIGFAALVVVLMRVLDALRDMRREVDDLKSELPRQVVVDAGLRRGVGVDLEQERAALTDEDRDIDMPCGVVHRDKDSSDELDLEIGRRAHGVKECERHQAGVHGPH